MAGRRIGTVCAIVAVAALLALSGVASAPATLAGTTVGGASHGCPKIIFYYSRGSGQAFTPTPDKPLLGAELSEALRRRLRPDALGVMTNAYTAFPAWPPRPFKYRASVANGVQAAVHNVTDVTRLCPESLLVLGGYSQGAQVTHTALTLYSPAVEAHIAAVALFGDALFDPRDRTIVTVHTADERLGSRRNGVSLQLHLARAVRIPDGYEGKVLSWCHVRDLVCQGEHVAGPRTGLAAHGYVDDVEQAVEQIANRLPAAAFKRYQVTGTCDHGGCALAVRSSPSLRGGTVVGMLRQGQWVDVHCQLRGQVLSSANHVKSDIWDELANPEGYVSDLYLDTAGVGVYTPGLTRCPPAP